MSKNYHEISRILQFGRSARVEKNTSDGVTRSGSFSKLSALLTLPFLLLFGALGASAQTVLIDPAGDGGFENGTSGWTVVNDNTNQWQVGSATKKTGNNSMYVSNDGGVSNAYTVLPAANQFSYFYKDVVVPAGNTKIRLELNWKSGNETNQDYLRIIATTADFTPVAGFDMPGSNGTDYFIVNTMLNQPDDYNSNGYYLPTKFAGTTLRLVFQWRNNIGGAVQAASVDDISLMSSFPANISSAKTGFFSATDTWVGGVLPVEADNIIIEPGHHVSIDQNNYFCNDVTVKGILDFTDVSVAISKLISIKGNLKIENGGLLKLHDGSISQSVDLYGNLINDGTIDNTISTTTQHKGFTFRGENPQTIEGSGSFGKYMAAMTFDNRSTVYPNIYLNANNIVIAGTMRINSCRIKMPTGNKFSLISAQSVADGFPKNFFFSVNTGMGFLPGATFVRYLPDSSGGTNAHGSSIAIGADPTSAYGMYPFVTNDGFSRSLFLRRSNTGTSLAPSQIAVKFTDANSITQNLAVIDGAYTINKRLNSNWTVTTDGVTSANTYQVAVMAGSGLYPLSGNSRLMYDDDVLPGSTHQNGSTTPSVQRVNITEAALTAEPLYVGLADADSAVYSVTDGDWEVGSTWSKNDVPALSDKVVIASNTTVSIDGAQDNMCATLTVASSGHLFFKPENGGRLEVGVSTDKRANFTLNGRLTMNDPSEFVVYGDLRTNTGSTFIQNGGDIVVDGNAGTGKSIIGKPVCDFNSSTPDAMQLNGGRLIFPNPHIGTNAGDFVLKVSQGGAFNTFYTANKNHTLQFGLDTGSVEQGNTANGFLFTTNQNRPYAFGKVHVKATGAGGKVRVQTANTYTSINGDLEINADAEYIAAKGLYVAGNITNNGTLSLGSDAAAILGLASFNGSNTLPATTAQTISGTGLFRNNATTPANAPTAKFTNIIINNTAGVTSNVDIDMSGTLTLANGVLNVANPVIVGLSSTVVGGLVGGSASSYVNGTIQRILPSPNTNDFYYHFPVGTASGYSPIWLAPTTTSTLTASAKALDTNAGQSGSLVNLATTSWIAPITGTYTDLNIRVGALSVAANSIPVLASASNGTYMPSFGETSLFTSGNPNTIQSVNPVSSAGYNGYVSYADPADCTGTPAPGAALTSSSTICSGDVVTLSLQNNIAGGKVAYQWKQSVNGGSYTNIEGATMASYNLAPAATTMYKCEVTCGGNLNKADSAPVQVAFVNNISSTQAAARCGYGSVTLEATANNGTVVNWYDTPVGGKSLGAGNSFATPEISETKDFYAAAETMFPGTFELGPKTFIGTNASASAFGQFFASVNAVTLVSVDVFPSYSSAPTVFTIHGQGPDKINLGPVLFSTSVHFTPAQVTAAAAGTPVKVVLNYPVPAGAKGYALFANQSVRYGNTKTAYVWPMTANGFSITGQSYAGDEVNDDVIGTSRMYYFNWTIETPLMVCSSPRVAVKATVAPSPQVTLSSNAESICGFDVAMVSLTSPVEDYDTYEWTPSEGVTGSAENGWQFNPSTTTTYTLVAKKGECQSSASLVITSGPKTAAIQKVCALSAGGLRVGPTINNLKPLAEENKINWYQTNVIGDEVLPATFPLENGATYYVSQILGCGESLRTPVTVEFNAPAAATGPATQYVCGDAKVDALTATSSVEGGIISWYLGTSRVAPTSTLQHNKYYTATVAVDYCESPVGFEVLVLNLSNAPIGPGISVGAGTSVSDTQLVCGATPTIANLTVKGVYPDTPIKWYTASSGTTLLNLNSPIVNGSSYYAVQDNSLAQYGGCPEGAFSGQRLRVIVSTSSTDTAPTFSFDYRDAAYLPESICEGATLNLPAKSLNGIVGTWSPAMTVVGITQTGNYVFNTQTCVNGFSKTIVVNVPPAAPIAAPVQYFCNSATIGSLSATVSTEDAFVNWYDANGGGRSLVAVLTSGSHYFGASVDLATGCESVSKTEVTANILVLAAPDAPFLQAFCNVVPTVSMLTATGTDITWYDVATGGDALSPTAELTTKSYFVAQTKDFGTKVCASVRRNVSVALRETAAPDTALSHAFCSSATLSDLPVSGEKVKWYASADSVTPLSNTADLANGSYFATQTLFNCESAKTPVAVLVNLSSITPTGAAAQTVNAGATIAALSVTGVDVVWYASAANALADISPLSSAVELLDGNVYYAVVTNGECRSANPLAVTVTVTPTLGVNQFGIAGLQFYPNPVVDYINISNTSDITSVRVFNMLGQGVMTVRPSVTNAKIDMSTLPMGTYVMEVQSEGKTAKFKVVKN